MSFSGGCCCKVRGALSTAEGEEDPAFLREQLITYLGNKRALLPFLGQGLQRVQARLGKQRLRIADLFAGTGVVARFCKRYAERLQVNDLEGYSRVVNACYLTNRSQVEADELGRQAKGLREAIRANWGEGFLTELYAPKDEGAIAPGERVFFTRRNAIFLDTACRELRKLPPAWQGFLLAPLLAEASVHANTSGVFKGFYKDRAGRGKFGGERANALGRIRGEMEVRVPVFSRFEGEVQVYQEDANALGPRLPEGDLVYLDPPYNQHPYGSNYFMLNLLVEYQRPREVSRVSGIPTGWRRSAYNQRAEAEPKLLALVEGCRAPFVMLSYNSEGFVPRERFQAGLERLGRLTVLETGYPTFRGSRNLQARAKRLTEYLFLLEKR